VPSTRLARRAELHTSASTQRLERQVALGSLRPDRAQRDSRIVAINLLRNYGQHNANLAGLRETTGDYVITMDDDGQNPADQVPLLIAEAMTGRDVVFGDYELKQAHGIRRLGSKAHQRRQPPRVRAAQPPGGVELLHSAARRGRSHLCIPDGSPVHHRASTALLREPWCPTPQP
jgi:hypothetical protein